MLIIAMPCLVGASQSPKPSIAFEVAVVKPMPPSGFGPTRSYVQFSPAGFAANGLTLKSLLQIALNIQDFQISGGPAWLDSETFYVDGRVDDSKAAHADVLVMLQTLLTERFQLKLHRETKEYSGYVLSVGRNGPKLKAVPDQIGGYSGGANGRLMGKRTIPQLCETLSGLLMKPVVDETGLTGIYQFTLEWLPAEGQTGPQMPPPPPTNPLAPSLFTAVHEQLGLRLQSKRVPIQIVVIDNAVKPAQ
jgi:uncharacterized protein (TIGR03435 family)